MLKIFNPGSVVTFKATIKPENSEMNNSTELSKVKNDTLSLENCKFDEITQECPEIKEQLLELYDAKNKAIGLMNNTLQFKLKHIEKFEKIGNEYVAVLTDKANKPKLVKMIPLKNPSDELLRYILQNDTVRIPILKGDSFRDIMNSIAPDSKPQHAFLNVADFAHSRLSITCSRNFSIAPLTMRILFINACNEASKRSMKKHFHSNPNYDKPFIAEEILTPTNEEDELE